MVSSVATAAFCFAVLLATAGHNLPTVESRIFIQKDNDIVAKLIKDVDYTKIPAWNGVVDGTGVIVDDEGATTICLNGEVVLATGTPADCTGSGPLPPSAPSPDSGVTPSPDTPSAPSPDSGITPSPITRSRRSAPKPESAPSPESEVPPTPYTPTGAGKIPAYNGVVDGNGVIVDGDGGVTICYMGQPVIVTGTPAACVSPPLKRVSNLLFEADTDAEEISELVSDNIETIKEASSALNEGDKVDENGVDDQDNIDDRH